jgi:hypothetical protein
LRWGWFWEAFIVAEGVGRWREPGNSG